MSASRLQHVSLQHVLLQLACHAFGESPIVFTDIVFWGFFAHMFCLFLCKQKFYSACTRHQFSL